MDWLQRRAGRLIVSYALVAVAALAVAIPLFPSSAAAQFFGQNKVQYKRFHWRVLRTQHFDIHYYQGTEAAVNDAALMAERAYQRLSRVLHHEIRNRVPLVLYASHTDFGIADDDAGFESGLQIVDILRVDLQKHMRLFQHKCLH